MALVSKGYYLNVTLVDSSGENKATLRYEMTSADFATLVTDVATVLAELAPVTDAVIVAYSFGERFGEDSSFVAAEGVQIEDVAAVSSRLDATQEKWATLRIPAPAIGIFETATGTGSNIVDPTDADLQDYLGLFVTTTGICTLSDGESLLIPGASNTKGKRIHRASRRG
jgi:hypothetical protein